jgi:hypothetical protein
MRFREGSDSERASSFFANLGKGATGTLAMMRQAFGEESGSRTHARFRTTRKARQVNSKAKSMLIIFWHQFVLAGQTANSVYYCHVLQRQRENVQRLRPELAVASRQRILSHFLFHQGIIYHKQDDCRPPPTLLLSATPIEYKTERSPFWLIEARVAGVAERPHKTWLPG